jgi:hypothetical protein
MPLRYSPARLAALDETYLAELYFSDLDDDPDKQRESTRAVIAEVERRGMTSDMLYRHWNPMRDAEAAGQMTLAV